MRKSPFRRRQAMHAALIREITAEHGQANDDSSKLQQGAVRSALAPRVQLTNYATPRENWEGLGKRPRKTGQRFTINGFDSRLVDRKLDTKS